MICLALMGVLAPIMAAAANGGSGEYRLLQLDGYHVKWGGRVLGSGARVSYAFANVQQQFPDVRNCGELVPMDELASRYGISPATLQAETAAAFHVWEQAADIRFVAVDDPGLADILIGAQARPEGRAFSHVAYQPGSEDGVKIIERALVCLNPDQRWKVGFDGDIDAYDLRYTLVHEIGHAIGLDHPGPSGQVMSFSYSEEFSELQPGDFRGVRLLYGAGGGSTAAANFSD